MNGNSESPDGLSRDELRHRQEERLRRLVRAVVPANPFWGGRFNAAGINPGDGFSLDDLAALPTTTKAALVEDQLAAPPYGTNLTFSVNRYSRLHQTSGTTGAPLRCLDTPESWEWIVGCWDQIYRIAGVTEQDVVAFPFSFGPFLGFWAAFDGACRMGALCLPAGGLTSAGRLQMMRENSATVVCTTPTYALRLAEVAGEQGLDLRGSTMRALIVAGEPGGSVESIRRRIESDWQARVYDHWGMTELGPLAVSCAENPGGLHVLETECIAEILDPASQAPVLPGADGELVVTNLGRTGSPLFRYRTGDLVRVDPGACRCGRKLLRLEGGILGRIDDMFTVRGNNVYPGAIESLLREFTEIAEYRIDVETRRSMQHVKITLEPRGEADVDRLASRVAGSVRERLNFQAEIALASPGELPRFELKARRVFHSRG